MNFFKLNQLLKSKQGVYLGSTKQLKGDFAKHKERLHGFMRGCVTLGEVA